MLGKPCWVLPDFPLKMIPARLWLAEIILPAWCPPQPDVQDRNWTPLKAKTDALHDCFLFNSNSDILWFRYFTISPHCGCVVVRSTSIILPNSRTAMGSLLANQSWQFHSLTSWTMQSTEVERCYVDWVKLKIKHLNVLGLNHLQCFCSFVQDVKGWNELIHDKCGR